MVALRPEEPVNATGNLVVWYGKEYDSNALQLLVSTPPGYEEVRRLGGSRILKVIG